MVTMYYGSMNDRSSKKPWGSYASAASDTVILHCFYTYSRVPDARKGFCFNIGQPKASLSAWLGQSNMLLG